MVEAHICDFCTSEMSWHCGRCNAEICRLHSYGLLFHGLNGYLCPLCQEEFERWLKNEPQT